MKRNQLFASVIILALVMTPRFAHAWSESGHHIIALLAFESLETDQQKRFMELLRAHPRFTEDFSPPDFVKGEKRQRRWQVGRAGYWPDVARETPEFNRPTWHYQLAATITAGDRSKLKTPKRPGPLPANATLQTQELHIAQAVELCVRVLKNKNAPKADRAVALCWLCHLVADAHQPCHAGSLYAERVFPEGDRGANSIRLKKGGNLHALWDGLLGGRFDEGDVNRRFRRIQDDPLVLVQSVIGVIDPKAEFTGEKKRINPKLQPTFWLEESREYAKSHVYTGEVRRVVNAASRGLVDEVEVELSKEYLERAGELARRRAGEAAGRLEEILNQVL